MATQGFSLVGFMGQAEALLHLRQVCIPVDPTEQALVPIWAAATAQLQLGNPMPAAGNPDIQDVPATQQPYIARVMQTPWAQQMFPAQGPRPSIRMVEIQPLLAFQFTVDIDRSQHHCDHLSTPPTIDELLNVCLPLAWSPEATQSHRHVYPGTQSIIIKSRSLNFRVLNEGLFQLPGAHVASVGVVIGPALPIAHVVRFNGRYYLHNGFHRAVGAGRKGATHIPCLVRDVATAAEAGIRAAGGTFQQTLLESGNPPTLGHFVQGRALPVTLRAMTRIVQISWSDHVLPDE